MTYEKPELITLSLAGTAVRLVIGGDVGTCEGQDGKMFCVAECRTQADDSVTSSSGGAYEADE